MIKCFKELPIPPSVEQKSKKQKNSCKSKNFFVEVFIFGMLGIVPPLAGCRLPIIILLYWRQTPGHTLRGFIGVRGVAPRLRPPQGRVLLLDYTPMKPVNPALARIDPLGCACPAERRDTTAILHPE